MHEVVFSHCLCQFMAPDYPALLPATSAELAALSDADQGQDLHN